MATYEELSAQDRLVVDNTINLIRASAGEMGRIWNRVKAIADDSNAIALVSSIGANDVIPNTSNLDGADDMTRSELVAVWTVLNAIRTANDDATNRAAFSKAAGINAMISE